MRATRSNTAAYISASFSSVRTNLKSGAMYSLFSASEVIWTIIARDVGIKKSIPSSREDGEPLADFEELE